MPKKRIFEGYKVLIIHYRVGQSDGVSLEISNWQKILKNNGAYVSLCAGPLSAGADYIIDDLEQQLNAAIYRIDENAFGGLKELTSDEFRRRFYQKKRTIERELSKIINDYRPTHVIISNMLCVGENLPAAAAITTVLDKFKPNTILVNHDFYWENERYDKPSLPFVEEILQKYFVPKRKYIKHCTINSIGQKELYKRKRIKAEILYDAIDFGQDSWQKRPAVKQYLFEHGGIIDNDRIILQATRIVRRKNIELAIDFIHNLTSNKNLEKLDNKIFYDGRIFNRNKTRFHFIMSGYTEKRDKEYFDKLKDYAEKKNVSLFYMGEVVGSSEAKLKGATLFSLEDIYPFADLVTYPSEYEGFGNQFLESVFAKKPVIAYEYPVFKSDIVPKGFKYISLGDEKFKTESSEFVHIPENNLVGAVDKSIKILTNSKKYKNMVEQNFSLGKKYFSFFSNLKVFKKLLV